MTLPTSLSITLCFLLLDCFLYGKHERTEKTMPIRRKKYIKKKKTDECSCYSQSNRSKRVEPENVPDDSDTSADRKPCASCRLMFNTQTIHGNCDNGGVQRIYSPFNRFANNNTRVADKHKKKMPQSTYRSHGLSAKEKSYVICSCQSRSTRYVVLKNLAASAMKYNKIFSIYGTCGPVRKALLERGWVEKIPANKMNLSKIRNGTFSSQPEVHGELERLLLSNLVERCSPNFIWRTKDEHRDNTIDMSKEYPTIVNKLKIDAEWTSKQGLCSSMKRNYWFYIEDVAEVNGPRTYDSYDAGEIEGFVKDYKITACTSLLKWVLSMVSNERPVFVDGGKISMNVVVFALNRCKEYLFRKQNKDIDRAPGSASSGQWNGFLKKYYRIIAKDDVFEADRENKLPLYLCYAKFLLKEIHRYRPQLSCEGCHNIWIIKPAHCSRGRGIRMASKLGVITNLLSKPNSKNVIQKYIEEPLLIHETKFDIRQYYLVTSTYPLVIWMYQDCYLKFSSQKYNLKNYHESIHLTNNAVQKRYSNCLGRHSDLPQNNMWDSDKYKDYLNRIGKDKVWDNIIYPGMKKSIIGIMLSCQDSLSICKNRFELYGCDFILDKEFKPWLIEINSCPDLNHTTRVTAKICPAVIADIIKVVIDYPCDPKSSTGKFECIYRQPMSIPRYGGATDLFVKGFTLPLDYFYRGNIEIKESYDDADIEKVRDVKLILNKMKQFYDSDIMVEPEDDCDASKKMEQETCTHSTPSEYELSVAATVITGQLDELMDRITSEHSCSSKSSLKSKFANLDSLLSSSKASSSNNYVKSMTDIQSLLVKSSSRFMSSATININKSFQFSDLDDGPIGKGSNVEFENIKKVLHDISRRAKCNPIPSISISQSNIIHASSNIISFIEEKEKEYFGHTY